MVSMETELINELRDRLKTLQAETERRLDDLDTRINAIENPISKVELDELEKQLSIPGFWGMHP